MQRTFTNCFTHTPMISGFSLTPLWSQINANKSDRGYAVETEVSGGCSE